MLGVGKPEKRLGRKRAQLLILVSTFGKADSPFLWDTVTCTLG